MQTNPIPSATSSVPRHWAWHYRQLMKLRERLLEEISGEMTGSAAPVESHSMDMADSATDEFDHGMTNCILSHEQDALHEVDAAIRRIFEGGYGVCEESGLPVPAARLRAVPWTRYTKEVEARLEQEGLISRTRLGSVASIRRRPGTGALLEADGPENEELLTPEELRHQRQADIRAIETAADDEAAAEPSPYKS